MVDNDELQESNVEDEAKWKAKRNPLDGVRINGEEEESTISEFGCAHPNFRFASKDVLGNFGGIQGVGIWEREIGNGKRKIMEKCVLQVKLEKARKNQRVIYRR